MRRFWGRGEEKSEKEIEQRDRNLFPLYPLPHLRFPLPKVPEEGLIRRLTCTPLWYALINKYSLRLNEGLNGVVSFKVIG